MNKDTRDFQSGQCNWAEVIRAQAKSSKTGARYCRDQGIPYGIFLYHRRKARRRNGLFQSGRQRSKSKSPFIPIEIPQKAPVTIRLAQGVILESDQMPDVGWLVELANKFSSSGYTPC